MNSPTFPIALFCSAVLHAGVLVLEPQTSDKPVPFEKGRSVVRLSLAQPLQQKTSSETKPTPRPLVHPERGPIQKEFELIPEKTAAPSVVQSPSPLEPGDERNKGVSRQDLLQSLTRPHYPKASRIQGEEGRVVVVFEINLEGRAQKVRVDESSGFRRLDIAAVQAVQKADFSTVSLQQKKESLLFQFQLENEIH